MSDIDTGTLDGLLIAPCRSGDRLADPGEC